MRAEDLKEWLRGIEKEEDPEKEDREGAGDRWRLFVRLIRAIWVQGRIPRQLLWVVVVLLPKGGGDYRCIGLLEPIWKVIEGVMDTCLEVIELHDFLQGYRTKRGTGTATVEAKLVAQLAYLEQEPFFAIFIDLRKAFDVMDRGHCLRILRGYGVGLNTRRLIKLFWAPAEMVCRAGESYGTPFGAGRGVTQGRPLLPKLFNILVDAIVREWLQVLFGDDAVFLVEGRDAAGFDGPLLRGQRVHRFARSGPAAGGNRCLGRSLRPRRVGGCLNTWAGC
ncbi:hypothetical protein ACHAWF_006905 [Thalassiosira exigua]